MEAEQTLHALPPPKKNKYNVLRIVNKFPNNINKIYLERKKI